jgi:signal transduction histidine kinase
MVLVIVSKIFKKNVALSSQFQTLRWQLLGSSLTIMMVVNLISNFLVYEFFARSLYQQIDQRLQILADSAAHSLEDIKRDHRSIQEPVKRRLDYDHDLDLSWQSLQQLDQSIEWFDDQQQLLGRSGKNTVSTSWKLGFSTLSQSPQIRLLLIPIYNKKDPNKINLEGYVRVVESTQEVENLLRQLSWGFVIGEGITLIFIGAGGMWLTQQSLKPLEKSYQQLKQFTGDASHELRSPLTAIKTSVEVLQTHPERIHPQDIEKLASIVSATNQMSHLVEDLLLLARTDNDLDLIHSDSAKIPVEELLEDIIAFFELQADKKLILVEMNCIKKVKVLVTGNSLQLQRLFSNLLDNAIKYTPIQGSVKITLDATEKSAMIAIEDTGFGIDSQEIPFLFDRFWRSEQARSPQTQGTGLGLAIAQSIAQRHGGKITVKSILGQGTCFTILLPTSV